MNDLGELSWHLCELLQHPDSTGPGMPAQRCALHGGRWIAWHFQPWPPRWLLGVGCATQLLESGRRARLEEALLRVGHASRWGQQAGMGTDQEVELVDYGFAQWPTQLTPAAVQDQLQALLEQFDALATGLSPAPAHAAPGATHARGCHCVRTFSAHMHALDATRPPGSSAAQELLCDGRLPLRITLHPLSHHWVLETFVWDATGMDTPLRRALVSTLLHINGAVRDGRALVCSLDSADRVVVISRWHLDWAAKVSVLEWLDYSLRQARRIHAVAAAIALHEEPLHNGIGSRE